MGEKIILITSIGIFGALLIGIAPFISNERIRIYTLIIALSILSLHTLLTQLWIYCFTSVVGLMGWVKQLRTLNDNNEKRINY
jgi:hypothetical protein|tara:strand:+ start:36 stop:284 length:249 start_codon:yes stop_codon:yes gene_type:complete